MLGKQLWALSAAHTAERLGHAYDVTVLALSFPPLSSFFNSQVKLQFEGRDKAALQKAVDAVREQLDVFTLAA